MNDRSLQETRAFFAAKAATWEEKYPDDSPAFAAAIAEMALPPGGLALDAGCGTGRAFPLLRDAVGPAGRVVGVDVTPEMIWSAQDRGRGAYGRLLIADVGRLPLRDGVADGVLASGLIPHVLRPAAVLAELARVTRPGGKLALFHPVGRAVLAARRGRTLTPGDVRAEHNIRPLLATAGWTLLDFDDTDERYLALARR
ncbi:MAG: methyltransferase domain-containing protein [Microbispora sp.]|nr:methyltransferase domain-containing protein [Microbispora sp.]